jgi:hypothetical protein
MMRPFKYDVVFIVLCLLIYYGLSLVAPPSHPTPPCKGTTQELFWNCGNGYPQAFKE